MKIRAPDSAPARTEEPTSRAAILDAAEALFGTRGFQKTTVDEIAVRAGVSRTLVYRYFRDKLGLFEAVVGRLVSEWNDVLRSEAARATPGTAHTLRLVLTACLDFARKRSALRVLLARDTRAMLAGSTDVIDRGNDLLRNLIQDIVVGGVRRGDVRADLEPVDVAHVVTEVFLAYTDRIVGDEADEVPDRRIHAIIETLLHGIIVQPEPAMTRSHDPESG